MTRPAPPPEIRARILLCAQGVLPDPERAGRREGVAAGAAIGVAAALVAASAGLVPALLAPAAALTAGLPAALWLSRRSAAAQAGAEGWRLAPHVQPPPDLPVGAWVTTDGVRRPPAAAPAEAETEIAACAASAQIRSPLFWTRQGPMAVLSPKPFRAAAWG